MNQHTEKIKELISAYIDGELNQEETSRVEDLLINHKEWQDYYKELQSLSGVLHQWEDEDVSLDLSHKVQKSLLEHKLKEDIKMSKPSFIKKATPVLTVAIVLIVGLLSMQNYAERVMQARVRDAEHLAKASTSTFVEKKYEPYYQVSNYHIQKDKFKGGVTRSGLRSDEVTTVVGASSVNNLEQEFWGGGQANNQKQIGQMFADYSSIADTSINHKKITGWVDGQVVGRTDFGLVQKTANAAPSRQQLARNVRGRAPGGLQVLSYQMPASAPAEYRRNEMEADVYRPYQEGGSFNTENYDRIYENEFLATAENPLSTFSIDVDTASYSNLRRFLNQGQLPPKDAVRIEEMVNYFSYNYPQPQKGDPFSVTLKASAAPWNAQHQLVLIGLQGMTLAPNEVPPSNLVFLIDVSGSMNQANKLPLLKESFKMMVNQLGKNERVAMVVYAGAAGVVLPSTSGADKHTILSAIDRLQAGGSTAGGAGIQLAYDIAKQNFIKGGNNRVILATDGDFNVGVSNNGDLVRMIEQKRQDGIFLTTLGFGMGNYKDSRMEQLANKGNGNHYYIDTNSEARKVLVRELGSTLFTIAKDVKLQVEFNPAQVKAYRLIGYENRMLKKEDFNDDTKDAGELGAGHNVTALYEIVPADSAEKFGTVDQLKYQIQKAVSSSDLLTVKLRYKKPNENKSRLIQESIRMKDIAVQPDSDFVFASAVAEFGLLLRDSQFKGRANVNSVLQRAREGQGADPYGYRAEFISLVEKAQNLFPAFPDQSMPFKDQQTGQHSAQSGIFFKGNER